MILNFSSSRLSISITKVTTDTQRWIQLVRNTWLAHFTLQHSPFFLKALMLPERDVSAGYCEVFTAN